MNHYWIVGAVIIILFVVVLWHNRPKNVEPDSGDYE